LPIVPANLAQILGESRKTTKCCGFVSILCTANPKQNNGVVDGSFPPLYDELEKYADFSGRALQARS